MNSRIQGEESLNVDSLINSAEIRQRVADLAESIRQQAGHDSLMLLAIAEGGLPLSRDLEQVLKPEYNDTIAVSSYDGQKAALSHPVLLGEIPASVSGRHVVIVDDIYDTGRTLALVKQAVLDAGARSVRICVLLSKRKTHVCEVAIDYCGFEIDDVFVVGYGLDYLGEYRDLPFVGILKEG